MINKITSRDNKILKLVRSLHRKKGRTDSGLYFAEGARLIDEALVSVPESVRYIIVSENFCEKNTDYINSLDREDKIVYITEDKLFNEVCDTESPQGIGAVIEMPKETETEQVKVEYILILDGVSEPGNMGTIIRTAEAAGVDVIYMTSGCVDIYNPKVVRSAMGSLFRMKFAQCDADAVRRLKADGFVIVATALYNSVPIEEAKVQGKRAIVIGNEAQGVSQEMLSLADMAVRIDMCGKVESLNAAVAAGIAMYTFK